MDFFTHMLMGYLIGWGYTWGLDSAGIAGYNESLILLSVLMAMIPDFDVFLGLIPGKYRKGRAFRHRGITHSILFIFIASFILAYLFTIPGWLPQTVPFVHGFIVALLGGLSHILLDGLTAFPFPFLAPFTWKEYSADIDAPVTLHMMVFSPAMILLMWYSRSIGLDISLFVNFVWIVFAALLIHYSLRMGIKKYVKRKHAAPGETVRVYHTPTLLRPYVVKSRSVNGVSLSRYERLDLLGRRPPKDRFYEVGTLPPRPVPRWQDMGGKGEAHRNVPEATSSHAPPKNKEEAIVLSATALESNGFKDEDRENISAVMLNELPGAWEVFWFDWQNWHPFRPTTGIKVKVDESGALESSPFAMRVAW